MKANKDLASCHHTIEKPLSTHFQLTFYGRGQLNMEVSIWELGSDLY